MTMGDVWLELVGVRVRVVADDARAIEPLAARWAAAGDRATGAATGADMVVELAVDAALGDRPHGPNYPALSRRHDGDQLHVERADVVGVIELGSAPRRARFRVAPHDHSVECAVRVALSVALPARGALMVHASAVERAGRAQLFAGVSGAGKSTIAAMLDGVDGFVRLADELVVVARRAPGAWALQVPALLGLAGLPRGAVRPLVAVHLIAQAPEHRREPLTATAALRELMRHVVVYAAEPHTAARALELVGQLVAEVPATRLHFRKDAAVAEVLA
jgi:hypothetical protein